MPFDVSCPFHRTFWASANVFLGGPQGQLTVVEAKSFDDSAVTADYVCHVGKTGFEPAAS